MQNQEQTRREFVKNLTILAGTSALFSTIPWLNSLGLTDVGEKQNSRDKVKLGIIGVGSRGSLLLTYLLENPKVEIVAYCDDYEPNYKNALTMTKGMAKGFSDYRKLLELKEIQGVVIATPLNLHASMSIDAMTAGKHVFCEKNMAMTMEESLKMYKTHKETGKILQVGLQRVFNLNYLKGMEYIKQGKLGQITQIRTYWHRNHDWRRPVPKPEFERRINWRLYKEYSLGLLTELACHQVHIANWVLNELPQSVTGFGNILYWKDGREVYDNVALVYNYPSGINLTWDSIISNKHYGLEEQVQGKKGTIEFEVGKYYPEDIPPAPGILQLINDVEKGLFQAVPIGGPSWVPETAQDVNGEFLIDKRPLPDDTRLEMEGFVDFVGKNRIVPGMAEAGYNTSIATIMGYKAIETKSIITWPEEFRI